MPNALSYSTTSYENGSAIPSYAEKFITTGGLIHSVRYELEHSGMTPNDPLNQQISRATTRFEGIFHSLNGNIDNKLKPTLPEPMKQEDSIDQRHAIEQCTIRNMPESLEILLLSYYTELLYAQVLNSSSHPIESAQQLAQKYKHIATRIFGEPKGKERYSDDTIKTMYQKALEYVAKKFPDFTTSNTPQSIAASAGDGLEVAELHKMGISTIACDILPLNSLGPTDGSRSILQELVEDQDPKLEFHPETDACDLLADRTLLGEPLVKEINSLGSSLNNTLDLSVILKFFYWASKNLVDGGVLNFETHFIEGNPELSSANPMRKAMEEFHRLRPDALPNTKGVHPDYRSDSDTDMTVGAQLHSYTLIRSQAHLCGFRFACPQLEDINQASQLFREANLQTLKDNQDRDPATSPIWMTENGTQRIFYMLEKVSEPSHFARVLLKYVYAFYNQRFPDHVASPSPAAKSTVM